jgi:hypothetical protein
MQGVKGIFFSLLFNLRVKLKVIDISNGYGTGMCGVITVLTRSKRMGHMLFVFKLCDYLMKCLMLKNNGG